MPATNSVTQMVRSEAIIRATLAHPSYHLKVLTLIAEENLLIEDIAKALDIPEDFVQSILKDLMTYSRQLQ